MSGKEEAVEQNQSGANPAEMMEVFSSQKRVGHLSQEGDYERKEEVKEALSQHTAVSIMSGVNQIQDMQDIKMEEEAGGDPDKMYLQQKRVAAQFLQIHSQVYKTHPSVSRNTFYYQIDSNDHKNWESMVAVHERVAFYQEVSCGKDETGNLYRVGEILEVTKDALKVRWVEPIPWSGVGEWEPIEILEASEMPSLRYVYNDRAVACFGEVGYPNRKKESRTIKDWMKGGFGKGGVKWEMDGIEVENILNDIEKRPDMYEGIKRVLDGAAEGKRGPLAEVLLNTAVDIIHKGSCSEYIAAIDHGIDGPLQEWGYKGHTMWETRMKLKIQRVFRDIAKVEVEKRRLRDPPASVATVKRSVARIGRVWELVKEIIRTVKGRVSETGTQVKEVVGKKGESSGTETPDSEESLEYSEKEIDYEALSNFKEENSESDVDSESQTELRPKESNVRQTTPAKSSLGSVGRKRSEGRNEGARGSDSERESEVSEGSEPNNRLLARLMERIEVLGRLVKQANDGNADLKNRCQALEGARRSSDKERKLERERTGKKIAILKEIVVVQGTRVKALEASNKEYEKTCTAIRRRSNERAERQKWAKPAAELQGPRGEVTAKAIKVSARNSACAWLCLSELDKQRKMPQKLRHENEIGQGKMRDLDKANEIKLKVLEVGSKQYEADPKELIHLQCTTIAEWQKRIQDGGMAGLAEFRIYADHVKAEVRIVDKQFRKTISTWKEGNGAKRLVMVLRRSQAKDGAGDISNHYDLMGASKGGKCQILFNNDDAFLTELEVRARGESSPSENSKNNWRGHAARRSRRSARDGPVVQRRPTVEKKSRVSSRYRNEDLRALVVFKAGRSKESFFREMKNRAPQEYEAVDCKNSFMSREGSGLLTVVAKRDNTGKCFRTLRSSLYSIQRAMEGWGMGFFQPLRVRKARM